MKSSRIKTLAIFITSIVLLICISLFHSFASADFDIDSLTSQRIAEIRSTPNTDVSGITGTVYYVSAQNGDDNNDGKSPESPWKTLTKVKSYSFKNNDALLFERGGIYRGHFSIYASLLIGSYGEGDKPRIYGSVNAVESGYWINVAENIWRYSNNTVYDIGNIMFDSDRDNINAIYGHKILKDQSVVYNDSNIDTLLKNDLEFYSVGFAQSSRNTATSLYLYSEENPNERFSQIELCEDLSIFSSRTNNVIVDNLEFRYTGAHGVNAGTIDGFTITNCEFAWIGGGIHHFNDVGTNPTRFGNAIEVYGTASNYYAHNNYIWQVYDAGITPQYTTSNESHVKNVEFSDNVIEYCNYSVEYWNTSEVESSIIEGFLIENNIMRFAGYGLCTERPDKNGAAHLKAWNNQNKDIYHLNKATDFIIRNNIFDRCNGQMMYIYSDYEDCLPVLQDNLFVQDYGKGGILLSVTGDGNISNRQPYYSSQLLKRFPLNNFTYNNIEDIQSGTTGDITWTLDLSDGKLILEGTGDFGITEPDTAPWSDYVNDIASVVISENITSIGNYAFYNCPNIDHMTISSNSTFISGTEGDITWEFNPEDGELTISGQGAIPDYEKYNSPWYSFAPAIKTITIEENITKIGTYAFFGCYNLEKINFNCIKCADLAKDPKDGNNGANFSFSDCGKRSEGIEVVFGEEVTYVPGHLFRPSSTATDSPKVTKISFAGNKCTTLANHCFRTLDDLVEITLPQSLKTIATFAFGNCSKLTSLVIPESVTVLSGYAFMNCSSLENITLPPAITNNYTNCIFANCYSLKTVTLPSGIKKISERSFSSCRTLSEVIIPETVTLIEANAFANCPELHEILIPASVETITAKSVGYINSTTKTQDFTIKCYSDSAAMQYAIDNGFDYIIMDHYGHTESERTAIESGCTTEGKLEIVCSCGIVLEEKVINPTGHNYISETTAPTCTEIGYTTFKCTKCSDTYNSDYIDAKGHSYNEVVTNPTCTSNGYSTFVCSECNNSYIGNYTDKINHNYKQTVTKPTCTNKGYTTYICTVCNESYVDNYTDAIGHDYKEVITNPTCTNKGYTTYICTVCNESYVDNYTDAIGHDYKEVITKSTCTNKGYTTYICTVCNNSYVGNYTDKTNHNYKQTVTKPTCTNKGYTTFTCTVCNESYKDNYVNTISHKDDNNDGCCDYCGKVIEKDNPSANCSCNCHKSGFAGFIYKIQRFFWKLFKTHQTCSCGAVHY